MNNLREVKAVSRKVWFTFCCCMATVLPLSSSLVYADDLEQQIEQARKALDEAAEKLAALHASKYDHKDRPRKAMLGILLGDSGSPQPRIKGVEMVGVTPNGGAAQAGLKAGDIIINIGGIELSSVKSPMHTLSKYMKDIMPGDSVDVVYDRGGQQYQAVITTQAESKHILKMISSKALSDSLDMEKIMQLAEDGLGQQKRVEKSIRSDAFMSVEGELANYFGVEKGVVLLKAPEGSELVAGDVILAVGQQPVIDVPSALMALGGIGEQAGDEKSVAVKVRRNSKNKTVRVQADEFEKVRKEEVRVIRIHKDGKHSGGSDEEVHVEVIRD